MPDFSDFKVHAQNRPWKNGNFNVATDGDFFEFRYSLKKNKNHEICILHQPIVNSVHEIRVILL